MIYLQLSLFAVVLLSSVSISKQYGVDLSENRFKKFYRTIDDVEQFQRSEDVRGETKKCGYEVF